MIPFATKYGSYWNCGCNRVLHTKDDLHKHMHEHAMERLINLVPELECVKKEKQND